MPTAVLAGSVTVKGSPSGIKADVDGTGALRVSNEPGIGQTGQVNVPGSWTTVIANDPTNYQIVTSINVDTWAVTPGINDAIQFGISQNGCASVSKTVEAVNPDSIGETEIGLGTGGLDLPLSWSLCVQNNDPTNLHAAVFALYNDY